jgi:hypothetical protein
MTLPSIQKIYDVVDGTWPAAEYMQTGPWLFRRGAGGGQRVSATTARGPFTVEDIATAEAQMKAMGQPNLFMIREGDETLDALLAEQGYVIHDPRHSLRRSRFNLCRETPAAHLRASGMGTTGNHARHLGQRRHH